MAPGYISPSNYTPATIAVETTATRFKVSVRHTYGGGTSACAGVAIFRATGVARRNLMSRCFTSNNK